MSNLYTDALEHLKLTDLKNFLSLEHPEDQRPIEGPRLDYKEDLSPKLGETVAAMSNTYGGIILIGVKPAGRGRNIPGDLSGANLGSDPRARITDKIISSVHPRPDFMVQILSVSPEKRAAVIRVREGIYPPYQYSQGGTIKIPLRFEDTDRQASVREIESLFQKRESLARNPEPDITNYFNDWNFVPVIGEGKPRDENHNKMILIPRVPLRLRLDSLYERNFESLVRTTFQRDRYFARARKNEPWSEDEKRSSSYYQWAFRIPVEPGHDAHQIWRVWANGTVGFATNHSIGEPEPIGNLAIDLLYFLKFADKFLEELDYFGSSTLAYFLASTCRRFTPSFPPPEGFRSYDEVRGIHFPNDGLPGQVVKATSIEQLDRSFFTEPHELVASILLDQLRELTAARVDFKQLLEAVRRLSGEP